MTPKKILFANAPFDGHFNPLVPLALHLKAQGHDVRWYTGSAFESRVAQHNIPFYRCINAVDIQQDTLNEIFPERRRLNGQVAKLKHDLKHVFILRSVEYFEDIKTINRSFDFDLMIADVAFTAIPFVKSKLQKPVISIGILPLPQSSVDLPPSGLGLTPARSFFGKMNQRMLRYLSDALIFSESKKLVDALYRRYKMKLVKGNVFDVLCADATLLLQSGTPGFEYYRSDLGKNIRFIGPLLPLKGNNNSSKKTDLGGDYRKRVLVTQGTVEKDPSKLILPTIEAFKNDPDVQVIVTTGGSFTEELRSRYSKSNIIIEDFIPFDEVMPQVDVFVTNGGYGGVLLSIENSVPMVVAGLHEGKNEICARVGYFNLGHNLRTETPSVQQVRRAVDMVAGNSIYKQAVEKLREEFSEYKPLELLDQYVEEAMRLKKARQGAKEYALFELEAA